MKIHETSRNEKEYNSSRHRHRHRIHQDIKQLSKRTHQTTRTWERQFIGQQGNENDNPLDTILREHTPLTVTADWHVAVCPTLLSVTVMVTILVTPVVVVPASAQVVRGGKGWRTTIISTSASKLCVLHLSPLQQFGVHSWQLVVDLNKGFLDWERWLCLRELNELHPNFNCTFIQLFTTGPRKDFLS